MEKKKEDEANVYKEMEQVGINGNKSDQVTLHHMSFIIDKLSFIRQGSWPTQSFLVKTEVEAKMFVVASSLKSQILLLTISWLGLEKTC